MPPEPGADPVVRLDEVSGRIYDMLHTSGIGGYLIPSDALMWVLRDIRAQWATAPAPDVVGDAPAGVDASA